MCGKSYMNSPRVPIGFTICRVLVNKPQSHVKWSKGRDTGNRFFQLGRFGRPANQRRTQRASFEDPAHSSIYHHKERVNREVFRNRLVVSP